METQMWGGGSRYFDEMTGEYSSPYTPPKLKNPVGQPTYPDGFQGKPVIDDFEFGETTQPAGNKWSSFNSMLNTAPMNGQSGWPSPDRKMNPWMIAHRATANLNRAAAQENNSFRQIGGLNGDRPGMVDPLGMARRTATVPAEVRAAAPVAKTAPVADLPTAVAQAAMPAPQAPSVPATITPSEVAAPDPYFTQTDYVNKSVMDLMSRKSQNYRGRIL